MPYQESALPGLDKVTLRLKPRCAEAAFFNQYQALDLIGCLMVPLFHASLMAFSWGLISTIYGLVLILKGYQFRLLFLPAAQQRHAHQHARYWLILAERLLRQCIATPLLCRGGFFQLHWFQVQAANSSNLSFCLKILFLASGLSVTYLNAFWLPLDFLTQAVVTAITFGCFFTISLAQISFVFQQLVQHLPQLLWLKLGLECFFSALMCFASSAVSSLQNIAGSSPFKSSHMYHSPTARGSEMVPAALILFCDATDKPSGNFSTCAAPCIATCSVMFQQPGRSPDVGTVAGRLILACSAAYMVFSVLLLPLYTSWRAELYFKSKWLNGLAASYQQARADGPPGRASNAPYRVYSVLQHPLSLAWELGVLLSISVAVGEVVVLLMRHPGIRAVFVPQVIY